jgi:ataxia telangiectasia mutated family protein
MRQDAVLHQIFNIVNRLLQKHAESRRRSLSLRTYAVVPLSSRSGLVCMPEIRKKRINTIAWVNNSIPLGNWLVDAHQRYHPSEPKPADCRQKFSDACEQRKPSSKATKLSVYREITRQLSPAFRHFFFEHFIQPDGM